VKLVKLMVENNYCNLIEQLRAELKKHNSCCDLIISSSTDGKIIIKVIDKDGNVEEKNIEVVIKNNNGKELLQE